MNFSDYLTKIEKTNLHPKINKVIKTFPSDIKNFKNFIIYGPENTGKYSQALHIISKYSPSKLKYEKRVVISSKELKDEPYFLKMSDIHFEVDMFLLGCNSKNLWFIIYQHITDIILQKSKYGIILCKNFHLIHNELLDVFYSYMQTNFSPIQIYFVILTEELSFIPNSITECCEILHIPKPYKVNNDKCERVIIANDMHSQVLNDVIANMGEFTKLRNSLYNIFIYQLNIYSCLWFIFKKLKKGTLQDFLTFFHGYNNNYRHIYHLELLMHQLS
jgi:hypothetical protein